MKEDKKIPEFSLLGGPLQRLGHKLGLVHSGTNTFWLGIALAFLAWGILMLLAIIYGNVHKMFSLVLIGAHVRLLVAIPLFFLCETLVAPRMAEFVRQIVLSGVVPETELTTLTSDIKRIGRIINSWLTEVIILLAVLIITLIGMNVETSGKTGNWSWILNQSGGKLTWISGWYFWFCLPLFRFLIYRWLLHLVLWWYFLWRVQKLKLHLIPTHPDGAAGLGYMEIVHEHFAPLAMLVSAVLSAKFAEDISSQTMQFESLYLAIPIVLILNAVLFICPLFIFAAKLWRCRLTGWIEYMAMADHYVNAFDRKWIRDEKMTGEDQLGTADMQSLADLTNSVNVVRNMRLVPVSRRLILKLAAAVILPLLPLFLLKYPLIELSEKLLRTLSGI